MAARRAGPVRPGSSGCAPASSASSRPVSGVRASSARRAGSLCEAPEVGVQARARAQTRPQVEVAAASDGDAQPQRVGRAAEGVARSLLDNRVPGMRDRFRTPWPEPSPPAPPVPKLPQPPEPSRRSCQSLGDRRLRADTTPVTTLDTCHPLGNLPHRPLGHRRAALLHAAHGIGERARAPRSWSSKTPAPAAARSAPSRTSGAVSIVRSRSSARSPPASRASRSARCVVRRGISLRPRRPPLRPARRRGGRRRPGHAEHDARPRSTPPSAPARPAPARLTSRLVDSGISPVGSLAGRVVNGPDFSDGARPRRPAQPRRLRARHPPRRRHRGRRSPAPASST